MWKSDLLEMLSQWSDYSLIESITFNETAGYMVIKNSSFETFKFENGKLEKIK